MKKVHLITAFLFAFTLGLRAEWTQLDIKAPHDWNLPVYRYYSQVENLTYNILADMKQGRQEYVWIDVYSQGKKYLDVYDALANQYARIPGGDFYQLEGDEIKIWHYHCTNLDENPSPQQRRYRVDRIDYYDFQGHYQCTMDGENALPPTMNQNGQIQYDTEGKTIGLRLKGYMKGTSGPKIPIRLFLYQQNKTLSKCTFYDESKDRSYQINGGQITADGGYLIQDSMDQIEILLSEKEESVMEGFVKIGEAIYPAHLELECME